PYCRSPYKAFGRRLRPPRGCRIGGTSSSSGRASSDSFRVAPVMRTASGVPLPSTSRGRFVPFLARSVGFLPVRAPQNSAVALAVHAGLVPVDQALATQAVQQGVQQLPPDATALPGPQAAPAGDPGAAAHLQGQHLPGDATAEDENDAGQTGAVIDGRTTPLPVWRLVPAQA